MPWFVAIMWGRKARTRRKWARMLRAKVWVRVESGVERMEAAVPMPALLIRIVGWQWVEWIVWAVWAMAGGEVRSQGR